MYFVLVRLLVIITIYVIDQRIYLWKDQSREIPKRSNESYHRLRAIIILWLLIMLLPFGKNVSIKREINFRVYKYDQTNNYRKQADVSVLSPFIVVERSTGTLTMHWNNSLDIIYLSSP